MRITTCAERIRKGLEIRNMKAVELCNKTGIPKSAMSQYINNKFLPKQDRVYLIAKALNVNEAWLMGYDVARERIYNDNEIPSSNISILDKYNKLNNNGQIKAESYIDGLLENPNYVKKEKRPVMDNEPFEKIKLAARNGQEINEEEFNKNIVNPDDLDDANDL